MFRFDQSFATAAQNLAAEEALLEAADAGAGPAEFVRVWEPTQTFAVIGRSSQAEVEIDFTATNRLAIPVYRRCSGGLAIVTGPGCLMYAVQLSYEQRPHLRAIDLAHEFVLGSLVRELQRELPEVARQGISDLTWRGKKFSGNSLRCKRDHLLYHGTLLYNFPLELIGSCLKTPPRAPEYRAGRAHGDFVTNVPLPAEQLRAAVYRAFGAEELLTTWPESELQDLVARKYLPLAGD